MGLSIVAQVEGIYYPILAAVGVPANSLTIAILSRGKCGLSKCITAYLMAMAAADLLVLIFSIILYEISEIYFPNCFLNYSIICKPKHVVGFVAVDLSVWLTVSFTFDRFVAICCPRLRVQYCTEYTATVVITTVCTLCILENAPIYFAYEPGKTINDTSWYCNLKSSFYTTEGWVAYSWADSILTPCAPLILIFLFNILTIKHILVASKIRKSLRGSNNIEKQHDPELQNRRKSIILLVTISASFILLWMTAYFYFICVNITDAQHFGNDLSHPLAVMGQVGYMLQLFSPCTNTFIYAVAQTKFRIELKCVLCYPFNLIRTCINVSLS
ncbi:probable G-protein coupled receptor 139 [Stegostoma tigrinum]|uniref:probable G-protein coupled receptor 139 n=1 Tax=Stegostoma tigrinum TaxID=3053191 RepID=UPI00202B2F5D|nr:probable G-protein coupled receptor 139 [Stegostoma tigrinum]